MIQSNVGIRCQCETVEDLQELETAVQQLIANLPAGITILAASMTGQVDQSITGVPSTKKVIETRGQKNGIVRDPQ